MDSSTAKAAGWEWACGKPPALDGVSCSHVVSPHPNFKIINKLKSGEYARREGGRRRVKRGYK